MGYRTKRLVDFARGMRESKAMLERERWPRERLEAFQRERLAELAAYAAARSPFWRERLPRGPVRLADLPVLTKDDLMESLRRAGHRPAAAARPTCSSTWTRSTDDALYLGELPSDGVERLVGAQGGVRLRPRGLDAAAPAMFLRRSAWLGIRPRMPRTRLAMVWGASPTHMSRRGAASLDIGVHRLCRLSVTQPLPELVARLEGLPAAASDRATPRSRRGWRTSSSPAGSGCASTGLAHQQRAAHTRAARPARAGLRGAALQLLRHHGGALRARLPGRLDAPVRRHVHRRERR